MNGLNAQSMYMLGIKLGLEKSKNEIKAGDVLFFGSESSKTHTAIAVSHTMALEAHSHYKGTCKGMPIQTITISELINIYNNKKVWVIDFLQKKSPLDASKYLENESNEQKVFVVKTIYKFNKKDNCYHISISGIGGGTGNYYSYVIYLNFTTKKILEI